MPRHHHTERHRTHRIGWLRAAVLGANDGIVSVASLMMGVAAANTTFSVLLTTGIAGLVAGAMSMAAGEYVSVSSQADTEHADLARERKELAEQPDHEHRELALIYESRGVSPDLAAQVAYELMQHDALGAHARDELGISHFTTARPLQAAFTSAITFSVGAALPLIAAIISPPATLIPAIAISSLFFLITLGAISANAGGASMIKAATRVAFWGVLAMGLTTLVGKLFGAAI